MNDPAIVADTSVLIHFLEGQVAAGDWLLGREVHVSIVTEIELRTIASVKKNADFAVARMLASCSIWDISPSIKERCIWLRSNYRLKLADALIAATAASLNMPLVTADKDFKRLKEVVDVRLL
ncbi:MAG: PIN domain-containing protein [Flavobacteriales bacterium]|nr:PIN domain-containing protein [Flavobacteriales bacterium]MEB2342514.1 PIN domain-containing protein [Flavobacteriia bacterium]